MRAPTRHPDPIIRVLDEVHLIGTLVIYDSQSDLMSRVARQWREFRLSHPKLDSGARFICASPCTNDRKIHYLTGVGTAPPDPLVGDVWLTLQGGEYAVVQVNDPAQLRLPAPFPRACA